MHHRIRGFHSETNSRTSVFVAPCACAPLGRRLELASVPRSEQFAHLAGQFVILLFDWLPTPTWHLGLPLQLKEQDCSTLLSYVPTTTDGFSNLAHVLSTAYSLCNIISGHLIYQLHSSPLQIQCHQQPKEERPLAKIATAKPSLQPNSEANKHNNAQKSFSS